MDFRGRAGTGTPCSYLSRAPCHLKDVQLDASPSLASTSVEMRPQGPLESPSWVGRGWLPRKSSSRGCMVCVKRNTWVGLVRCEPALDNHKDEPTSGWAGGAAGVPVRRVPALGPHPLWYQALCSFCRPSQSSHGALWRLDDRVVLITRICFLVMVTHLSNQPIGQGEGQNHNHSRFTGFQT